MSHGGGRWRGFRRRWTHRHSGDPCHMMLLLLLLSACAFLPSVGGVKLSRPSSEALLRCLQGNLQFTTLRKIRRTASQSLPQIETYGAFTKPVFVLGPPSGLLAKTFVDSSNEISATNPSAQSLIDTLLKRGYGNEYVRWHFASGGSEKLPSLNSAQDFENFLSFEEAMVKMEKKRRDTIPSTSSLKPMSTLSSPSFFSSPSKPSACTSEILSFLVALGNIKSSPLYAISSNLGLMDANNDTSKFISLHPQRNGRTFQSIPSTHTSSRVGRRGKQNSGGAIDQNDGEKNYFEERRLSRSERRRKRAHKRRNKKPNHARHASDPVKEPPPGLLSFAEFKRAVSSRRKTGFVDRMLRDKFLNAELPLGLSSAVTMSGRTASVKGMDVYFGNTMSGTFWHAHGPAISSSTGRKLWMLYSPSAQCELETAAGVSLLAKAGLPPMCRREWDHEDIVFERWNKFHKESSLCLAQLHPLEVLSKLGTLDRSMRPMLVLQEPGEIMVLPGRWHHMTLNLEDSFTVSYQLPHPRPRNLGCPVRQPLESWKTDL